MITMKQKNISAEESYVTKEYLPHSDVVIYGLSAQNSKVDVNPMSRRNSNTPHTVLEVWVFLGVTGRVNGPI